MWITTPSFTSEVTKGNIEKWLDNNHPFKDKIWLYSIKDLSWEHARSWTAFMITDTSWKRYKLRVCLTKNESTQTEKIVKNHKKDMPYCYGKDSIWWVDCYLFDWLEKGKDWNDFDASMYKDEYWEWEPVEMYKKVWKVMWSIHSRISETINPDWESFKIEIQKRIDFCKVNNILAEEEINKLYNFFSSHFNNPNLRFWRDFNDAHRWNFMINEENIHRAYVIDEWAINDNYLQWAGFGFYLYNKQANNEEVILKLLRWYFKKNPNMVLDVSYVELIFVSWMLRKIRGYFIHGGDYDTVKNKLISFLKIAKKNEWYDSYKEKFPWVYNFLKVYNNLKQKNPSTQEESL